MLRVQEFLMKYGLEKLKSKYKIKVLEHEDGRMLLNYDQIESPKMSQVTRDCRGLCLNKRDFSLIARSFRRFFNAGECAIDDEKFNWSNCSASSKEDGTCISTYWYNNKWNIQTRGSFGDIPMYEGGPTFEELFYQVADKWHLNQLDKHLSYTFELCSRHNKIVRDYEHPKLFLLSSFKGAKELPYDVHSRGGVGTSTFANLFDRLDKLYFSNIEQVQEYIKTMSQKEKSYEGIVLRDNRNIRLKVKSPTYLALHRMAGPSGNVLLPKNLSGFVLAEDTAELLIYYKECEAKVNEMITVLAREKEKVLSLYAQLKDLPSRKDFALAIPQDFKLKSFLFRMKDGEDLNNIWKESAKLFLEVLF